MANGKELREMLARTRDQKFRTKSDAQIEGYIKLSIIMKDIAGNKSAEWKENIAANLYKVYQSEGFKESRKTLAKEKSVPVITPYGEFDSQAEFKRETGESFSNKSNVYPHLYYTKDKGIEKTTYQKIYYSPYGYHYKKIEVLRMAKNAGEFLEIDETRATDWFNQQKRITPDQYYFKTEPKREWALEDNK